AGPSTIRAPVRSQQRQVRFFATGAALPFGSKLGLMITNGATKPGCFESALTRLLMKRATVTKTQVLSEHFRCVTLSGDALRDVRWTLGQKVHVAVGSWVYRTYTLLTWNAARGETELILFLHGDAPGAAWGCALTEGDDCALFGSRHSL